DPNSILDGTNSGGLTIASGSQVSETNSNNLTLRGAIHNSGTISLNSPSFGTDLITGSGGVTLDGHGTVTMDDHSGNAINGSVLSNVDNTIEGGGSFDGGLTLVNLSGGTINATATNTQLVLHTTSHAVINQGLIEATGSAGLLVNGTTIDNTSGGVLSAASGSHVDLQAAVVSGGIL